MTLLTAQQLYIIEENAVFSAIMQVGMIWFARGPVNRLEKEAVTLGTGPSIDEIHVGIGMRIDVGARPALHIG